MKKRSPNGLYNLTFGPHPHREAPRDATEQRTGAPKKAVTGTLREIGFVFDLDKSPIAESGETTLGGEDDDATVDIQAREVQGILNYLGRMFAILAETQIREPVLTGFWRRLIAVRVPDSEFLAPILSLSDDIVRNQQVADKYGQYDNWAAFRMDSLDHRTVRERLLEIYTDAATQQEIRGLFTQRNWRNAQRALMSYDGEIYKYRVTREPG